MKKLIKSLTSGTIYVRLRAYFQSFRYYFIGNMISIDDDACMCCCCRCCC